MKVFFAIVACFVLCAFPAKSQFSAQKDAQYIATLKAVVNYKINDEENLSNIEKLRENARFNQKLQRMLDKLQNTRTKNSTNQKVYDIMIKAGKEIYNALD